MSMLKNINKPHIRIGILVFLMTILAFGIGYLIGDTGDKIPIIIEQVDRQAFN